MDVQWPMGPVKASGQSRMLFCWRFVERRIVKSYPWLCLLCFFLGAEGKNKANHITEWIQHKSKSKGWKMAACARHASRLLLPLGKSPSDENQLCKRKINLMFRTSNPYKWALLVEVAGPLPDTTIDIMGGVWQEPFFETAFRVPSVSSDRRYKSTEQNHRFHKVGKLSM